MVPYSKCKHTFAELNLTILIGIIKHLLRFLLSVGISNKTEGDVMTYRQLPKTMYTDIHPTPVKAPELVVFNDDLAAELGLDTTLWKHADLLAGNVVPEGFTPIAQAYLGHQFGYPAMLGDGRAILLTEILAPDGEIFDIQLKGSGRTPYSRRGDGRAAIGPMLREYLISEAMHALRVPTSRSLAVVLTGEPVYRERALPGAILTRVASSHLRVGTLQYARTQDVVKEVADYAISRNDPLCAQESEPYLCFFQEVLKRQAKLIARWQALGFIHGVMNTDNMALSGETIDYGPCAFMDTYRSDQVFSSIDQTGRYRYANQPPIAKWNLARMADSLIPLIDTQEEQAIDRLLEVLNTFEYHYHGAWRKAFGDKLGLKDVSTEDDILIKRFLSLLENEEKDFTNTFIELSDNPAHCVFSGEEGRSWHRKWIEQIEKDGSFEKAKDRMLRANPRVIPRNAMVEEVLQQAHRGDIQPFLEMNKVLKDPFAKDIPKKYMKPADKNTEYVTYCGT